MYVHQVLEIMRNRGLHGLRVQVFNRSCASHGSLNWVVTLGLNIIPLFSCRENQGEGEEEKGELKMGEKNGISPIWL